jgi:hypothetical protein
MIIQVYLTVTLLEGSWDRVHEVIGQAHTMLHQQGVVRIQTDIRVGSRYVWSLPLSGVRELIFGRILGLPPMVLLC